MNYLSHAQEQNGNNQNSNEKDAPNRRFYSGSLVLTDLGYNVQKKVRKATWGLDVFMPG